MCCYIFSHLFFNVSDPDPHGSAWIRIDLTLQKPGPVEKKLKRKNKYLNLIL
jgi:hypothetical protein